jgi:hypothetical protein
MPLWRGLTIGWKYDAVVEPGSHMIRKPFLSLLLPVLLLLAQQGAVLHELGHFAADVEQAQARGKQPDPQRLPGAPCEKCVVFAHFAGAVAPAIPAIFIPQLAFALFGHVVAAQRSSDSPSARSRGPPSSL